MNRTWTVLLFAMVCVYGSRLFADPRPGDSYEVAVKLKPVFYHEISTETERWIKQNVSDALLDRNGRTMSYGREPSLNGRNYRVEYLKLRSGSFRKIYFDTSEMLSSTATTVDELFFFPEYLQIIRGFDYAEVAILHEGKNPLDSPSIDYRRMPEPLAQHLKMTLLDCDSYRWDGSIACWPDFYVSVRLHRGSEMLDLKFCFQCGKLGVFYGSRRLPFRDFISPEFRKIFAEIFPQDSVLSSK